VIKVKRNFIIVRFKTEWGEEWLHVQGILRALDGFYNSSKVSYFLSSYTWT